MGLLAAAGLQVSSAVWNFGMQQYLCIMQRNLHGSVKCSCLTTSMSMLANVFI